MHREYASAYIYAYTTHTPQEEGGREGRRKIRREGRKDFHASSVMGLSGL